MAVLSNPYFLENLQLKREKPKILQKVLFALLCPQFVKGKYMLLRITREELPQSQDAAYKLMSIAHEQGRLVGTQILLQELQKGNSRLSHYLDVLVSDSETEDMCFMSLKHCHSLLSLLDSAFHGRIVCPAPRAVNALCNSSSVMDGIASLQLLPKDESKLNTYSEVLLISVLNSMKTRLGGGGFGIVLLCVLDGKDVAIKLPRRSTFDLLEEAQIGILSQMVHKNIVQLLGCGSVSAESIPSDLLAEIPSSSGYEIMLVYEYCNCGTLHRFWHPGRLTEELTMQQLTYAVCGMAAGLAHMHKQDILHRDIKPDNLFLRRSSKTGLVTGKVGDIGLCAKMSRKLCNQPAAEPWRAPECRILTGSQKASNSQPFGARQITPSKVFKWQYSTAKDVYSFGMSLGVILIRAERSEEGGEILKPIAERYDMSIAGSIYREKAVLDLTELIYWNVGWGGCRAFVTQRLSSLVLSCLRKISFSRPSMHEIAVVLAAINDEF
ncbi:hypothetical protein CEUSTIGMA_g13592.t1 [Chlamydomonas eustigma]|uniref:Protein kinase domain-containing protein n=1 Tax=Chlamydomonas eustigma TaxID=1157962 RepID=A0A250XT89_9CHLO|nr:hypothetical protein CEUSTIGMA_g13592.t1 [Chlamydomonas eustigma]|eukprot:GAX86179.1 hypothetical protein CEUSTIGMA_g13592.t1 [Chlamydomonas eustigma]